MGTVLTEKSLDRWGFKMAGDVNYPFCKVLNGVYISLEYEVIFNKKIICLAPETEEQFEALFYGLTGTKLK